MNSVLFIGSNSSKLKAQSMLSKEKVQLSLACIQEKTGIAQPVELGLVAGSGLGEALAGLQPEATLRYADIEGFPDTAVEGHSGTLVLGRLAGRRTVALLGRAHLYEGHDAARACHAARVLAALGCTTAILTNAAGSLDPASRSGTLMLISDHINLTGQSPLTGPNEDSWGPRFPDCSQLYPERLRALARAEAERLSIPLSEGVYMQVAGPQYETPAEVRAFRLLGADAVGMSTAIETLALAHMGVGVLALSCLTNVNTGLGKTPTSHCEVVDTAARASRDLARLVEGVAAKL